MGIYIQKFSDYLSEEKGASYNTKISYERDLRMLSDYLVEQGIEKLSDISETALNSYVLYLERMGKAPSTVSRYIASFKGFFEYCKKNGIVAEDLRNG